MKKLTLLLAVVFAAATAFAGEAPAAAAEKPAAKAEAKAATTGKTHDVEVEVVSADTTKNTITIKGEKGESTAPVEGAKAQADLKNVKPGQKVTLTCQDDEKGGHKAVTAIKTTAAAPATK
jgi:hypothetical protein